MIKYPKGAKSKTVRRSRTATPRSRAGTPVTPVKLGTGKTPRTNTSIAYKPVGDTTQPIRRKRAAAPTGRGRKRTKRPNQRGTARY